MALRSVILGQWVQKKDAKHWTKLNWACFHDLWSNPPGHWNQWTSAYYRTTLDASSANFSKGSSLKLLVLNHKNKIADLWAFRYTHNNTQIGPARNKRRMRLILIGTFRRVVASLPQEKGRRQRPALCRCRQSRRRMPVEGDRSEEVTVLVVVLDLQWQELVVVLVSGEFDGEIIPAGSRAGRRRARKRARGRGRGHEGSSCWRGVTGWTLGRRDARARAAAARARGDKAGACDWEIALPQFGVGDGGSERTLRNDHTALRRIKLIKIGYFAEAMGDDRKRFQPL